MYPSNDAVDSVDTKDKGGKNLADAVLDRCVRIVAQVNAFKRPASM
jgi:hypothetical protein